MTRPWIICPKLLWSGLRRRRSPRGGGREEEEREVLKGEEEDKSPFHSRGPLPPFLPLLKTPLVVGRGGGKTDFFLGCWTDLKFPLIASPPLLLLFYPVSLPLSFCSSSFVRRGEILLACSFGEEGEKKEFYREVKKSNRTLKDARNRGRSDWF